MKSLSSFLTKIKYNLRSNYWISLMCNLNNYTILEGHNKVFEGANVKDSMIGLGSYIGFDTFLPKTKVGRFTSIGPRVRLYRGKHPTSKFVSTHPAFYSTRKQSGFSFVSHQKFEELDVNKYVLDIGSDVWIGAETLILEGVKIGDGVIIGAGSVVTKDLEPYGIYVGNPLKLIRFRFSEVEVKKLLELRWWDKDLEEIKQKSELFENINNINKI